MRRPWPLSVVPARPPGMSLEEARLAGLEPPAGYLAPAPPRVADALRTAAAAATLAPSMARASLAMRRGHAPPGSSSAEGLAALRAFAGRLLARLDVTLTVEGAGRVPASGGLVFMWNQASHLDHLVLPCAIPRPFHSVYNNELRKTPLYGRLLARGGHFWVDRTDEAQWRRSLAEAAASIRAGACVLISPEGTRSWDGRLLPMKRGAFFLAREAARPIVCVTLVGAGDRLPRGASVVRAGPVRVILSDPIPVDPADSRLEATVAATFERELG